MLFLIACSIGSGINSQRAALFPPAKPQKTFLKGKMGSHTYAVRIVQEPFLFHGRKPALKEGLLTLDGKPLWGIDPWFEDIKDGKVPSSQVSDGSMVPLRDALRQFGCQISIFEVWLNGKKIAVPKKYWDDLLDVGISSEENGDMLGVRLTKDGTKLMIEFGGSDGAGGFSGRWTIHSTGKVTRTIQGPP